MTIVLSSEERRRLFRDVLEDVLRDGHGAPLTDIGLPEDDAEVRVDAATHLDARSRRPLT